MSVPPSSSSGPDRHASSERRPQAAHGSERRNNQRHALSGQDRRKGYQPPISSGPPPPPPTLSPEEKKVLLHAGVSRYVDLNMDLGQTRDEGLETLEPLLAIVTSVNLPCCVHDGHPVKVLQAALQAKKAHCSLGAHIAYPDPVNQGYMAMNLSPDELKAWLLVQFGALKTLLASHKLEIEHVRPHGALYAKLAEDETVAMIVAQTLYAIDPWLILIGPAGPLLDKIEAEVGLRTAPEYLIGKRYTAFASEAGAIATPLWSRLHEDLPPQAAMEQARQLLVEQTITTHDGQQASARYKTLHINPRLPNAVTIAQKIQTAIKQPMPLALAAVSASGWPQTFDDRQIEASTAEALYLR